MKFKLSNSNDSFKDESQPVLFFNKNQITGSLLTQFKQLEKLAPLLQKKLEKPNQFFTTFLGKTPIAFFSLDDQQKLFLQDKASLQKIADWIKEQQSKEIVLHLSGFNEAITARLMRFLVQVLADFDYELTEFKFKPREKKQEKTIYFTVDQPEKYTSSLEEATVIAHYIRESKNLANLPSNICTPYYLAHTAKKKAKQLKVACTVFDKKKIKEIGMHSFLSVAKGSRENPYFICLEYKGADEKLSHPIVMVGKGITFDSGGISLKPALNMDSMKFDMCGAACVIMAFFAAVELKLPINLVTLVPTCENMPSGRANKPGDIVKSLKGLSIEILNTDAEGRLILCDALSYAEKYRPSAVIDVATLTGACVIALGEVASGLLGRDEQLVADLLKAAEASQDKAWRLPLWEEYAHALESPVADLANVALNGGAGTITAASFLSNFIDTKYPWAHLDVAGSAWGKGTNKLASGRPVPLLIEFLKQRASCA